MTALVFLHVVATAFMTGLIWFVQVVHYPLLERVGEVEFINYERRHMQRTSMVVAPVMAIELLTIPATLIAAIADMWRFIMWINVSVLVLVWLLTMLVLAPTHQQLANHRDPELLRRLVTWNWLRTILWTVRSVVLFVFLATSYPCL